MRIQDITVAYGKDRNNFWESPPTSKDLLMNMAWLIGILGFAQCADYTDGLETSMRDKLMYSHLFDNYDSFSSPQKFYLVLMPQNHHQRVSMSAQANKERKKKKKRRKKNENKQLLFISVTSEISRAHIPLVVTRKQHLYSTVQRLRATVEGILAHWEGREGERKDHSFFV